MHDGNAHITGYLLDLNFGPLERPSTTELKKRWKELCRVHHPDHGGEGLMFRKVTHAYKMLTDSEYRSRETARVIREEDGNLRGDLDLQINNDITFEDAFFGVTMNIAFSVNKLDENLEVIKDQVIHTEAIRVVIPPGSTGGYSFVAKDKGNFMGDLRGDVAIHNRTKQHESFTVHGMSVYSNERLPLYLLIRGGKLDVQTMYGIKPLKVPPGTKPGAELKIPGCGVAGRGNHLVKVQMVYPDQDELKETDNWKGLDIDWSVVEEDEESAGYESFFNRRYGGFRVEQAKLIK